MKEKGLYDYNDMILWVIEAFKNHPALLETQQERFQFILVDEFQDTNGSQNDLIMALTDHVDQPNIFVVGDDDQSVYEFQGARIRNIVDFYARHKDEIKIIVLPQNYRSSQCVLDWSSRTIGHNKKRLINELAHLGLNKDLVAAHRRFANGADTVDPIVLRHNNTAQEEISIVKSIEQLQAEGVALSDVAIIYSKHKLARNIINVFERKGIPYFVKSPINVLHEPLVQQIVSILQYLREEVAQPFSGEHLLYELLHAPHFGIAPVHLAALSLYIAQDKGKNIPRQWRLALLNGLQLESLGLPSAMAMHRAGNYLDQWISDQKGMTLLALLERIIFQSGLVAHIVLQDDRVMQMQVLDTFVNYVKRTVENDPATTISQLLITIERMTAEKIPIRLEKIVQNDNGVRLYTAHGSKGNEFEHVYIIGAVHDNWEKKRGSSDQYKLPPNITSADPDAKDEGQEEEIARRLFYVALTRAKKHLHISYADHKNDGKDAVPTKFIYEMCEPASVQESQVSDANVLQYIQAGLMPTGKGRIEVLHHEWMDKAIREMHMSASSLNSYLECPITFYYQNLLKVPSQKGAALSFGSAVHSALEQFYRKIMEGGEPLTKEELIRFFEKALFREGSALTELERKLRIEQGRSVLGDYYDTYLLAPVPPEALELSLRTVYHNIPITGKADRLDLSQTGYTVTDYKTGDPEKPENTAKLKAPDDKNPEGGAFWRQMTFYKILLENDPKQPRQVHSGVLDFVEKGRTRGEYRRFTLPLYQQDVEQLTHIMRNAYARILNHDFSQGCGKESCHWCNFNLRYGLVRDEMEVEML